MRNKLLKIIIYCLSVVALLTGYIPVNATENNQTVGEAKSFIDGIVDYKLNASGAESIQQWIDDELTQNAGQSSEWYIIALSQSGNYDFSKYEKALLKYLSQNKVYSASSRLKYALALVASGSTDEYIYTTLNDSIGQQGVMSYVFGLHLLNNGYTSEQYSLASLKDKILSLQLSDGGWAVTGTNSDVDVTAMTIQALAPYYNNDSKIKAAVDKALALLSDRQKASGAYASYGIENPESTAQVLVALSSLGIDCMSDSRFIKNECTLFDGIEQYLLSDGTFCHKLDGGYNETATVQVFYAMVSYNRMKNGKTPLYVLDKANPEELETPDINTTTNNTTANNETTTNKTATNNTTANGTSSTTGKTNVNEEKTTTVEPQENVSQTTTAKPVAGDNDKSESTDVDNQGRESEGLQDTENSDEATTESDSTGGATTEGETDTTVSSILSNSVEAGSSTDNTGTHTENDSSAKQNNSNSSYKIWISLLIVAAAGGVATVLYIRKDRNKKNYLIIVIIAIAAVIFTCVTDFKTPEEYYNSADETKENVIGTVSLSIRCDMITDKADDDNVPEDGIILDLSQWEIEEGDTVYDVLMEATAKYKIHIETTGSGDGIYVEGINYIYEFDYGDLSGWMYFVDGAAPSVGCGEYELTDGEVIEWQYTCELGNDLK